MKRRNLIIGIAIVAILVLISMGGNYWQRVLIEIMSGIIFAAGIRLIYITGRLTLGHAAFLAIGAYTSALLATKLSVNPWLTLLAGGIAAGIVSVVLGSIILRVAGIYFVCASFAFSEMLRYFCLWAGPITGGATGILNIPTFTIGGFSFGIEPIPYLCLIVIIAALAFLCMYRMEKSRIGRAFHAIGQRDELAQHLGINLTRYRILAFTTAGLFAGLAGGFQAHYLRYICPDDFPIFVSLYGQVYAFVGGMVSPVGPAMGSFIVIGFSELLRLAKEVQPLFLGIMMVLIMLFLPDGLVSLPKAIASIRRRLAGGSVNKPMVDGKLK